MYIVAGVVMMVGVVVVVVVVVVVGLVANYTLNESFLWKFPPVKTKRSVEIC
jgi:hypothetical protein